MISLITLSDTPVPVAQFANQAATLPWMYLPMGHLSRFCVTPSKILFKEAKCHGGFGVVYRACLHRESIAPPGQCPASGGCSEVAIKKLKSDDEIKDERLEKRLARELLIMLDLQHPNIIELQGFHLCTPRGEAWVISSWVSDGNARAYTKSQKRTDATKLRLITHAGEGLKYLHSQKICHCDVKAENLLVDCRDGRVDGKLCDFGLAYLDDPSSHGHLATETRSAGTTPWCSPEALNGEKPTPQADVWSFGCLAYEVMTGTDPFVQDGPYLAKVVMNILNLNYPDVSTLPGGVKSLVLDCWKGGPEERIPISHAVELLHTIELECDNDGNLRALPSGRCTIPQIILASPPPTQLNPKDGKSIPLKILQYGDDRGVEGSPSPSFDPRHEDITAGFRSLQPPSDTSDSLCFHRGDQPSFWWDLLWVMRLVYQCICLLCVYSFCRRVPRRRKSETASDPGPDPPGPPTHARNPILSPDIPSKRLRDPEDWSPYAWGPSHPPKPLQVQVTETVIHMAESAYGRSNGLLRATIGESSSGHQVAVKVLHDVKEAFKSLDRLGDQGVARKESIKASLLAHISFTASLDHRHINPVLGYCLVGDLISPVTRWCKNGDVGKYLEMNPSVNRWAVVDQIAAGLESLHTANPPVIHTALKMENVLVDENGAIRLAEVGGIQLLETLTSGITTCGKLSDIRWVPQTREKWSVESDVYTFGLLTLAILTGKLPYASLTDLQVTQNKKGPPFDIPRDSPLWDVLGDCFDVDPQKRPSLAELRPKLAHLATSISLDVGMGIKPMPLVQWRCEVSPKCLPSEEVSPSCEELDPESTRPIVDPSSPSDATNTHQGTLTPNSPNNPDTAESLSQFAKAVLMRYQRKGRSTDLSCASELHRIALTLRPPGHPDRSSFLKNLANVVLARYERDGRMRDLSECIQLYHEVLSLRPPGHPDRPSSLNNLAKFIRMRYDRFGGEEDLEKAIQLHGEALSLRPPGHPDRSSELNNLANAVLTRYERDGGEYYLEEAIQLHRETVSLLPPGHPDRSSSLSNLARAVTTRYERDGDVRDLEEAITLNREALSLFPPDHPNRSSSLNNLARAVLTRYKRDGEVRDLEEAIMLHREALALRPPGHPNRSSSLSNLAGAVTTRYERDGDVRDLSEAITLNREALSLFPPGHPNRSSSLSNLAGAVTTRYERDGDVRDLEEAITLNREALSLRPPGHPDRSSSFSNLAGAVTTRYERDGEVRDLEEGIMLHREALFVQPLDDPNRSSSLRALAATILMQYRLTRGDQNPQLMEEIIQLLRHATAARTSPIPDRLEATLRWIGIAVENHPESALEAYRSAFTHLSSALALASSLQARHTNLLSQSRRSQPPKDLALRAALWALNDASGNPMLAVELLDQGRNVLLASVGQLRADLSDVRRHAPTLADDFYRTSRVLDSAILTGQEISERKSPHEDPASRYKRISTEWEDTVARIRLLPNCESFLLPVPYVKLQEAAVDGPVIIIVVGKERSTAIIVMPKGEPHTVDLPAASEEALKTLHQDMDAELGAPVGPEMRDILSDLWRIVVQPIIQELQDVLLLPTGSRIWWYPTSWASFLPLHAAGSYTKGGLNVPKLYISSYTPTLQALGRSRRRLSTSSDRTVSTLIVSQAQTPGQVALPSVDEVVGIVSSLVPDAFLLSDDQGTRSNVLKELHNHSWIHLSCHGVRDPLDPSMSHFALHDGPLTLQDIVANDLPSADFAYLDACHSAAQDRTLPDEGLTLAGGMQFAGFNSVVGAMWGVADEDAPTWAGEFYKGLAMKSGEGKPFDCTKAAESLHDAAKELRRQKVPSFRWMNLVHYGI